MSKEYIPIYTGSNQRYLHKEELKVGRAYYVSARNFSYAIWDGKEFNGLRYKFGTWFMDKELHYDDGAPFGTVLPFEELVPNEL
jgi:hypothetical protein